MDCQDVGKVSKTVPFDKITDCDVEEPAGSSGPCCCLVENVLVRNHNFLRLGFDHAFASIFEYAHPICLYLHIVYTNFLLPCFVFRLSNINSLQSMWILLVEMVEATNLSWLD